MIDGMAEDHLIASRVVEIALGDTHMLGSDAKGVTIGHVAIEALLILGDLLGTAADDPTRANLGIQIVLELLDEVPHDARHGALMAAFHDRFRSLA